MLLPTAPLACLGRVPICSPGCQQTIGVLSFCTMSGIPWSSAACTKSSCIVGAVAPSRGLLLPERHHPFFCKGNAALFAATKSNHDVGLLLRAPPPDEDLDPKTCYSCSRIFARRLFTSPATQAKSNRSCPTFGPCYSAGRPTSKRNSLLCRNLCRPFSMLPACSVVCCLRAKNASTKPCLKLFIFCWVSRKPTSRFQRVFVADLLARANRLLPADGLLADAAAMPAPSLPDANIFLLPADPTQPSASAGSSSSVHPVQMAPQALDYQLRGSALQLWPLWRAATPPPRRRSRSIRGTLRRPPSAPSNARASDCFVRYLGHSCSNRRERPRSGCGAAAFRPVELIAFKALVHA